MPGVSDEILENRMDALETLWNNLQYIWQETNGKCGLYIRSNGELLTYLHREKVSLKYTPRTRTQLLLWDPEEETRWNEFHDRLKRNKGIEELDIVKVNGPILTTYRVGGGTDPRADRDMSNFKFKLDKRLPDSVENTVQDLRDENEALQEGLESKEDEAERMRRIANSKKRENKKLAARNRTLEKKVERLNEQLAEKESLINSLKSIADEEEIERRKEEYEARARMSSTPEKGREAAKEGLEKTKSEMEKVAEIQDIVQSNRSDEEKIREIEKRTSKIEEKLSADGEVEESEE